MTGYKFYIRRENDMLAGGDEAYLRKAQGRGLTTEQISMDWRYVGY